MRLHLNSKRVHIKSKRTNAIHGGFLKNPATVATNIARVTIDFNRIYMNVGPKVKKNNKKFTLNL